LTNFPKTHVLVIDPKSPNPAKINQAAEALHAGKLVAFPTETVYGLGANALDPIAIDRIYAAKQRPAGDPVIAHIYKIEQLNTLAIQIPESAYALAKKFWPGPLTLVLHRAPNIPDNIATGRETIAVRMPAHPVAVALLKAAKLPIAAPSANTFTRPSATTATHVLEDLEGRVDIVLDGGSTTIGLESTVLDLTVGRPEILRPGGLVWDDLKTIIPDVVLAPRYVDQTTNESSPGQTLKHYSPHAQVVLLSGTLLSVLPTMQALIKQYQTEGKRVGVLIADEDAEFFVEENVPPTIIKTLGPRADLETIGHNLFAGLRDMDAEQADVILTYDFGREGLGAALWDRLLRAAEGQVIVID
jgi:L-threonylcarbamoyladenylate synthase